MTAALPYRLTFAVAALVAAVIITFFVIGIADGTVSSFNIRLWAGTLGVLAIILFGAPYLHGRGYTAAAVALLAILALPGLLYALFILLVIVSGERWN